MVAETTATRLARLEHQERTGEVLEDKRKSGKLRPWRSYKLESLDIADAYRYLGELVRSARIAECGSWLQFAECPSGHQRKLVGSNFCRSRLCSMCSSRRAQLIASQVRSVGHAALLQQPALRFIFLTLTVPNVAGEQIGAAITDLYCGFQRLWRSAKVKRIAVGYFRALELKYNRKRGDYHPHLHILVAVPPRYFKDWYLPQQAWLEGWRNATRNPDITQVDVRVVKPRKTGDDKLAGAAAEVGKYIVTSKDLTQNSLAERARVVAHIHAGLSGRRLTQYGGLFAVIKKQLRLVDPETATTKDLIAIGDDPSCHCVLCQARLVLHVYFWLGGRTGGDYVG